MNALSSSDFTEADDPFALFRRWFLFGIPGFGSVMIILWLMIAKPF